MQANRSNEFKFQGLISKTRFNGRHLPACRGDVGVNIF